jgi:hypothetical protein
MKIVDSVFIEEDVKTIFNNFLNTHLRNFLTPVSLYRKCKIHIMKDSGFQSEKSSYQKKRELFCSVERVIFLF